MWIRQCLPTISTWVPLPAQSKEMIRFQTWTFLWYYCRHIFITYVWYFYSNNICNSLVYNSFNAIRRICEGFVTCISFFLCNVSCFSLIHFFLLVQTAFIFCQILPLNTSNGDFLLLFFCYYLFCYLFVIDINF